MPESSEVHCRIGVGGMETPDRQVTSSVDLGGRLRRTPNVQDHVPRFLLGRIDAKCHSSPPFVVDGRENLTEALAILLRDVHDPEVQIELIARWFPSMEFQRDPSIELVIELFEPVQHVTEEFLVLKGFERIEVWHVATYPYREEVQGRSAQTLPASTVVGYERTADLAGGPTTWPERTSKRDPCHGHCTTNPASLPSHKGPPKWLQVLSRQYTWPFTLNRASLRPPTSTHFVPSWGMSSSAANPTRMKLHTLHG